MTFLTLVVGSCAATRESAIAAVIDPDKITALILEGLSEDWTDFDKIAGFFPVHIARIAAGCVCCAGNLILRVTLHRMLRHSPAQIYVSLATATHLDLIRNFLKQTPYDALFTLTEDMCV